MSTPTNSDGHDKLGRRLKAPRHADPAALRQEAEARVKHRHATSPPLDGGDLRHLQQELEIHQTELELQNESLLETQVELQTSLERYTDFYDFAPVGYLTLGPDGEIRQLNLSAAKLLGADRSGLVSRRLGQFVCVADRAALAGFLERVFASEHSEACEVSLMEGVEPLRAVRLEAVCWSSGQECRAVLTDISERKRSEAILEQLARANEFLHRSILALNACSDLDSALACLVEKATELSGMDCGAAYLIEGPDAVLRHSAGLDPEFVKQAARQPLSTRYIAAMLERPREVLDVTERFPEKDQVGGSYGLRYVCCLGLVAGGSPFGFLNVASRRADPPSAASIALIRVLATETESLFVRLQAENRLRRLSLEQHIILDSVGVGIGHLKDRKMQWVNSALETMLGYAAGELAGRETAPLYVRQEDCDRVGREGYALLAEGGVYSGDMEMRRKDGSPLWCSIVGRAVSPANPEEGSIWVVSDITERRQITKVLRASEERHRSILASMEGGVVLQARDGTITDCNQSAEKILGLSRNQIMGRTSVDPRWRAVGEDGQPFPGGEHPAMLSLLTGQGCRDVSMGLHLPDGSRRWININAEPMFQSGETQPYAVVTSFTDVTARRQIEARLRQAQKLEAIVHLTGGVAHEFNNILASIMAALELSKLSGSWGEDGELLGVMETSCQRAARLVKQLLASSAQSVTRPQSLDFAATVAKGLEGLRPLLGDGITLEFKHPPSLSRVWADKALVELVVRELCVNAQEAMPSGGVLQVELGEEEVGTERGKRHLDARAGRFLRLVVGDTGHGMDEQTLKRLFEPFLPPRMSSKVAG